MAWWLLPGGVLLLILIGLAYWQLVVAEGAYLGRRVVVALYDLYASRYDRIKQFQPVAEDYFLGRPLALALSHRPIPWVLDVATGTGRLPLTLLRQPPFTGQVIALDLSRRMLRQAARRRRELADTLPGCARRWTLLWQDAQQLPFPDGVFDAVTCLEALEFLPDPPAALAEMVRVLQPGGLLLVTNRIGSGVRWLPGRTYTPEQFAGMLTDLGLTAVETHLWQVDYNLVWARKPPGAARQRGQTRRPAHPLDLLCCPACGIGPMRRDEQALHCTDCRRRYPIAADGVVELTRSSRRFPPAIA